jgi:ketosteroid isomerase-like protein
MRRRLSLLAALVCLSAPRAAAQLSSLPDAAETVRRAWQAHDVSGVVASGAEIVVQLPGAEPAPAVHRSQAAALLRGFLAGGSELQVTVRSAREIEPGVGYVELARRFRVAGTREVRSQRVLLGYRRGGTRWELAELRVVE